MGRIYQQLGSTKFYLDYPDGEGRRQRVSAAPTTATWRSASSATLRVASRATSPCCGTSRGSSTTTSPPTSEPITRRRGPADSRRPGIG
jgi:hypothetical protein